MNKYKYLLFLHFTSLIILTHLLLKRSNLDTGVELNIYLEILLFSFACRALGSPVRIVISLFYGFTLGLQVSSLRSTGDFVSTLTLDNLSEFRAIGHSQFVETLLITLTYCLVSLTCLIPRKTKFSVYFIVLIIPLFFINGAISNFSSASHGYYKQLTYKPSYNYPDIAKKYLKFNVYENSHHINFIESKPKNVIIVFTEGFSSHVIDRENTLDLHLTPNIDKLYDEGVVVKNYYNHTAATFRGLRGQLTSAYQYRDGTNNKVGGFFQISHKEVETNYFGRLISLPSILKENDFNTFFLASTENDSNLNALLKSMPFRKVYGMEDFGWKQGDRMSDKKVFESLKQLLESYNSDTPFFIGVYPSGTHHGMDSPDVRYKDGNNKIYNKFYNYDYQLGEFINYFKKSKYYNDTILVITADHASFPAPEFKKSFDVDTKYFVDKIPLVIIGAGVQHTVIDGAGKNSLSLTPTILNMLGIKNHANYFIGCSLFDNNCHSPFQHISAIGDDIYIINKNSDGNYEVNPESINKDISEYYTISG